MIKINLLGDDTVIDHTAKLMVAGYVLTLLLVLAGCFGSYVFFQQSLASLTSREAKMKEELVKLQKITQEVRDLEKIKNELSMKLQVMAKLKRAKPGPVRVLSDLNDAVPQRSWLSLIDEKGGSMKITGVALDNETIASFMQDLERSNYVKAVDLEETKQKEEQGAKVKEFAIKASIDYSGTFSDSGRSEEEMDKSLP